MKKVITYTEYYYFDDEEIDVCDAKLEFVQLIKESRTSELIQNMEVKEDKYG